MNSTTKRRLLFIAVSLFFIVMFLSGYNSVGVAFGPEIRSGIIGVIVMIQSLVYLHLIAHNCGKR